MLGGNLSCAGNCYRANVSSYQPHVGCAGPAGRRERAGSAHVWGGEEGGIASVTLKDAKDLEPFLK